MPIGILLLAVVVTALLCGAYLLLARRRQWLDHPNHRSSHVRPTPHGGGIAIIASLVVMAALAQVSWPLPLQGLLVLAVLLMVLGVLDDLWQLSVRLRFGIYAFCCLLVTAALLSPLGGVAWLWLFPATLALLWLLNLYNFMDGIDGLAALQCVTAAGGAGLLALGAGSAPDYVLLCLLLAACHLGFLFWNWPPAKLFMGDAGSIPTGFLLGALAVYGHISGALSGLAWVILLAAFIVDATWTLLCRWRRGDNVLQAHREHLYQRLSRRWHSHRKVDIAFLTVFFCWLLPLAWLAQTFQDYALFPVIFAYVSLLFCMAKTAHMT